MNGKRRQAKKTSKNEELRRDEFKNMLRFVNSEPEDMGRADLASLAYTYTSFIIEEGPDSPFLSFGETYQSLIEGMERNASPELIRSKRDIFIQLKNHLCARFDNIIAAAGAEQHTELLKIHGEMRLSVNGSGLFDQDFNTIDGLPDRNLDLDSEKLRIDKKLFIVISDLDLRADRFRKCAKNECGNYFYQETARKKSYCSQRCAGAVRQKRFIHRQHEERNNARK